ncbi:leucine-rich repeat-containing protein 53 [Hippopotamus amphibius kiboko]|uniref:leucine-rich repeat-containing protein 53 n=1 Tax=Hippopotamus amphibius kiboko TaxID=575201 RepID=UPI002592B591|nr:leucine-rich repeat-containing protein 53 [Hippopotamus amphibius kiboko]
MCTGQTLSSPVFTFLYSTSIQRGQEFIVHYSILSALSNAWRTEGGWLVLFALVLRSVAACPASCVLCTKDVTLCHQLTYTVAAPVTTRVLIITDGYLSSIEGTNLSLLFNLALLSLSRNGIEDVREDALHSLSKLRTLLLEHNQISSSSLSDHTFSKLRSLQVLVLSNNALRTLQGSWFRNTRGLTRLQLDGNQITNLTDSSFGGTNLHSLRHLDLSNNFISYIGKDAFRPLPQLQEVDLSRNRLAHMPDVFTPLKQLTLLSLDKNQWSCTCDLYPLARFLRNYMKSSARTLRNAKDLSCLPSTTSVSTAKSVLRLSETNCDSKAANLTLVLKDRSPFFPGQDVALLTVLGFAGAVGLTCLALVVFNWKLQQGKANEHTSENLPCRTFDESLCDHEARNYHAKGDCNCHLTQENEVKVMSIVGSRKEMTLLQENSHQAVLACESTALDGSFRNLKGRGRGADSTFFCFGGRLLQSGCSEPPGNMAAFNEAGLLTRYCPKRAEKLRNHEPGEVQPQTLPQHVTRTVDISSDTFSKRYATSASALARESLEKHLTNESWQPPIEKGDNGLQPHRQRHFITGSSSKPRESEEHSVQKILQKQRSKYDDSCGRFTRSRPGYFQPNNSLICKYVPCDQFQDYVKEKKPNRREHSKPKKEQIQIKRAIEKFLMSEDNMELSGLSTKIKKTYSPKRVSFHHPDLVEKNNLVMSSKTSSHWKEQKNQSNYLTSLDLKKCSNPQERNKGGKWLTDPQILKKKGTNQSDFKGKIKGQNLRIKLNLNPFRKVRIHPEKSLPELPKKRKRVSLQPNKFSKASEKEAKINLVSSADFCQQSEGNNHAKFPAKRLPLKHAPKQTPYCRKNIKKAPLLSADNLSVANQSSVEDNCHPTGHIPDRNPSTLPQPTPTVAEHRHSHSPFSTEQVGGAAHLALGVPNYLPATLENTGKDISPSHHSTGATEHMEQDKSKTSELSQFSLSLGNQIHRTDTYKENTLEQNQTLLHAEQLSSHEQLGNEGKTLMTKPKISHPIVESCVMDEGNDVGKKLPKTETYDSSPVPWTQSKGNLTFMKINSIPYQNRIELPKDISTPLSTQAIWPLPKSSENGSDSTNALPRDDGAEALEIKIVGKEEKKMLDESKANSSMLMKTTRMTLNGATKEKQQTWQNGKSEKHLYDSNSVEATIAAKDLRMTSSHETKNRLPCSEIDLKINSNMYDLKEVQNIQPDKDNSAHKEGAMTGETLPELKDISFEAENEVSIIPRRINEAENSAPKPALYLLSAEYVNSSSLEAEQSEQNNSNNNPFLP